ncbi:hypothetical protein ACHAXR_001071 [Thalassiosira sp. AJA248-18]
MNAIPFCFAVICIISQGVTNEGMMVDAFQLCRSTTTPPPAVIRSAPFYRRATATVRTTTLIITNHHCYRHSIKLLANKKGNNEGNEKTLWSGIAELWDEVIEMSTYGPSERKMLKAQRERQLQLDDQDLDSDLDLGAGGIDNQISSGVEVEIDMNDDGAWMDAFTAAKDSTDNENYSIDDRDSITLDYDGYAMQDLLLSKWGIPLDIDFQRFGQQIYCTILPQVGYGSPLKSRHDTELNYLMHLQGVVEILHKYNNLENFVAFVETTKKRPKSGTDSVPFRLDLSDEDLDRIMQQ